MTTQTQDPRIVELQGKLREAQQKSLAITRELDGSQDFGRVKALEGSDEEKRTQYLALDTELKGMFDELTTLQAVDNARQRSEDIGKYLNQPSGSIRFPDEPDGRKRGERLSLPGNAFVASDSFVKDISTPKRGETYVHEIGGLKQLKALFNSDAAVAPELRVSPIMIPSVPPMLIDLLPSVTTGSTNIEYLEQTTRTFGSGGIGEGDAYHEATIVYTERDVRMKIVAHFIPLTQTLVESNPAMVSTVDDDLMLGWMQDAENEIINGNGANDNSNDSMIGFLNQPVTTGNMGSIDAVTGTRAIQGLQEALDYVLTSGRATPTAILINTSDFMTIAALQDVTGNFPIAQALQVSQGLRLLPQIPAPFVFVDTLPRGTALVGAFMPRYVQLYETGEVMIDQSPISAVDIPAGGNASVAYTKPTERMAVHARGRLVLVVKRKPAFAKVLNLNVGV